jgi:hypothetical protein
MKLLFCNSNLIGSWIIRKLTFSQWSHVAIVDGDYVIEAVWPRVRRVPLAHVIETHRDHEFAEIDVPLGHIELFPADIDVDFESIAMSFAESQIGKLYDLRALFGLITPTRDWERPEEWDCAELVAAAINAGSRKPIFRDKARVTPQMLYLMSKAAS